MTVTDALLLLGGAGLALFGLLNLRAAYGVYRGAAARRPRNVSHEHRQPPQSLAPLLGALTLLGFRRFGEMELVTPDTSALGALLGRNARHTIWLMLDGPETTLAEVVEPGQLFSLESWFSDESIVQTMYPHGEDIDVPGFRATAVAGSPAAAYEHHRRMVDARSSAASPVGVHSLGEYLRHDASYRERFATLFLRRAFIRGPLLSAAVVLLLAGAMLSIAVAGSLQ